MQIPTLETATFPVVYQIKDSGNEIINGVCMATDVFTSLEDAQKFALIIFNKKDWIRSVSITKCIMKGGYTFVFLKDSPINTVARTLDLDLFVIEYVSTICRQL
jgi:hypothetical protein